MQPGNFSIFLPLPTLFFPASRPLPAPLSLGFKPPVSTHPPHHIQHLSMFTLEGIGFILATDLFSLLAFLSALLRGCSLPRLPSVLLHAFSRGYGHLHNTCKHFSRTFKLVEALNKCLFTST